MCENRKAGREEGEERRTEEGRREGGIELEDRRAGGKGGTEEKEDGGNVGVPLVGRRSIPLMKYIVKLRDGDWGGGGGRRRRRRRRGQRWMHAAGEGTVRKVAASERAEEKARGREKDGETGRQRERERERERRDWRLSL